MYSLVWLCGPVLGPLTVWLIKKNQSSYLDRQGRELLNFQLSYLLYGFVSYLHCYILIGIPLLRLLPLLMVVLLIISFVFLTLNGMGYAAAGKVYRFPLTIRLL